ncbi:hypothetical protein Taro_048287 [Colocasia esculenta]|uniref:Uncharacterized protein n=1 Tax=Colocasia esculenta TaxID=4460 RepID=A0A843X6C3_COLES|nr:hypothetical protein [Colocasia esculenta]
MLQPIAKHEPESTTPPQGTDYWFRTPVSNPDNTTQEPPLSLAVTDVRFNCHSTTQVKPKNCGDPPNHHNLFTHFCLGSVDTRSKQVDTSPRFQKTQLPDWDSRSTLDQSRSTLVDTSPRFQKGRSTLDQGRSTLDPVSSRTILQKWDSRSTLDQGRSTHSG